MYLDKYVYYYESLCWLYSNTAFLFLPLQVRRCEDVVVLRLEIIGAGWLESFVLLLFSFNFQTVLLYIFL